MPSARRLLPRPRRARRPTTAVPLENAPRRRQAALRSRALAASTSTRSSASPRPSRCRARSCALRTRLRRPPTAARAHPNPSPSARTHRTKQAPTTHRKAHPASLRRIKAGASGFRRSSGWHRQPQPTPRRPRSRASRSPNRYAKAQRPASRRAVERARSRGRSHRRSHPCRHRRARRAAKRRHGLRSAAPWPLQRYCSRFATSSLARHRATSNGQSLQRPPLPRCSSPFHQP